MSNPLPNASMNKIHHLVSAKTYVEKALAEIHEALGDSDVTNSYEEDLYIMIRELEADIEDVWVNR
jgi:hypothetical protein